MGGKQEAAPILLEGLKRWYTGLRLAGIAVFDGSGIKMEKTSG
jgi:glucosamine 6-phosphate synthetase-like amidotransferase/phosphosugar isomerase protein